MEELNPVILNYYFWCYYYILLCLCHVLKIYFLLLLTSFILYMPCRVCVCLCVCVCVCVCLLVFWWELWTRGLQHRGNWKVGIEYEEKWQITAERRDPLCIWWFEWEFSPKNSKHVFSFSLLSPFVSSFTLLSAADGVPVQKDGEQVSLQQWLAPLVDFLWQWTVETPPEEPTWLLI